MVDVMYHVLTAIPHKIICLIMLCIVFCQRVSANMF